MTDIQLGIKIHRHTRIHIKSTKIGHELTTIIRLIFIYTPLYSCLFTFLQVSYSSRALSLVSLTYKEAFQGLHYADKKYVALLTLGYFVKN